MNIAENHLPALATASPNGHSLPLMEHFLTVQGEGAFSGQAAYFLRLGGCDVGCHWCDVKESWDAKAHPQVSVAELVGYTTLHATPLVVITGGEPLMHNLDELTTELQAAGKRTHVETSGAHPLSGRWDWITLSPKKFKPARDEYYPTAHELKVVVYNRSDLEWAEEHAARVAHHCLLYLQPEWSRAEAPGWIVDYVKQHPRWRISLQTHKYLNIP